MGTSFKDTLKPFDDFKNKPQKFWSNIFWYVKVNIFWKFIQYTLHYDKTQIKKISFGQNKRYKNSLFRELQVITVSLLIRNSYTSWSTCLIFLKLCVAFSMFRFRPVLLKFIFLFTKSMDCLTLQRHNSFQNQNNKKATYSFAPGPDF